MAVAPAQKAQGMGDVLDPDGGIELDPRIGCDFPSLMDRRLLCSSSLFTLSSALMPLPGTVPGRRHLADMIRHQILPAVSDYADQLCQRAYHKDAMGVPHQYETSTAMQIGTLTDALQADCAKLEADLVVSPWALSSHELLP